METKNIIIAEFKKDRTYFEGQVESYRGNHCKLDRIEFLKLVMSQIVSEEGVAFYQANDNGADAEILLECSLEHFGRKASTANLSARSIGDAINAASDRQRELYRIMR